jgi:hypothetical protein
MVAPLEVHAIRALARIEHVLFIVEVVEGPAQPLQGLGVIRSGGGFEEQIARGAPVATGQRVPAT